MLISNDVVINNMLCNCFIVCNIILYINKGYMSSIESNISNATVMVR